LIGASGRN